MLTQDQTSRAGYWFIVINVLLGEILLLTIPGTFTGFLKEDAIAENLGALFLLLTSLVLLAGTISWYRSTDNRDRSFWLKFLLLIFTGIAFFWAAGEEISWGQRIFDISTPESLKAVNQQRELNLHNLNTRFFNNGLETIILLAILVPTIFRLRNRDHLFGFVLPSFPLVLGFQLIACYVTYHYIKPQDYIAYLILPVLFYWFIKQGDREKLIMVGLNVLAVIFVAIVNIKFKEIFPGNGPREFREYLFSFLCLIYALELIADLKQRKPT